MNIFSSSTSGPKSFRVTVLGAAGGIGQPLSLLLKSSPTSNLISQLALYDIVNMGMSVDLSHIPTPTKVEGYSGKASLHSALKDAEVVVIPAGVPRKPGMTRDDLFNINAGIVRDIASACAEVCPNAHLLVISNPVNSTVPIAYEVLRKAGVKKPSVFGITTLDVTRAKAFIGELKDVDPAKFNVNVVGGHSGPTIVPLLSSCSPKTPLTDDEIKTLTQRVQYGGDEVVKAKDGGGSATLSMAYAANEFVHRFLQALSGESNVIENTFIRVDDQPTKYLSSIVELGRQGVLKVHSLPHMSDYEQELYKIALEQLAKDISKGELFVTSNSSL